MSIAKQAAGDIKSFISKFDPLFSAAKLLDEIGDLDAAAYEFKQRKSQAEKDFEKSHSVLLLRKQELLVVEEKISDAKEKAEDLVSVAQRKAEAIVKKAEEQVLSLTNSAKINIADLESQFSGKRKELSALESEVNDKKNRLAFITKELAATKSKLSEMVRF